MQITLLPSAFPHREIDASQHLTSFVVNGVLAVDAGSLGLCQSPDAQARIRHVVISHTHIDHTASLPVFIENVYERKRDCVTIHGSAAVLDSLRRDMFNGRVWPDFVTMAPGGAPFLRLSELKSGDLVELDGLRVTPIPVNHLVPTQGFIIEDGQSAVVITSDTGPTAEIWERANALTNLRAVFLEVAFPNAMADVAGLSLHLTPATFAAEVRKITRPTRVLAVHMKPRFRAQIVAELATLALPGVEVAQPGMTYEF